MLNEKQKEIRSQGVGGSEISACLWSEEEQAFVSVNPHKHPLNVYAEKIGKAQPIETNEHMMRGQYLGPALWDWYQAKTNHACSHYGKHEQTLVDDSCKRLIATPDARIYYSGKKTSKPNAAGEAKCPHWRSLDRWGEPGTDEVPDEVVIQVHAEMAVLGVDKAHVIVPVEGSLETYNINRNEELINHLRESAERFWNYVEKQEPPPVSINSIGEDSWRVLWPTNELNMIDMTSEHELLVKQYLEASEILKKEEFKLAEQAKKQAAAALKVLIQSHDGIRSDNYKVTFENNKPQTLIDYASLIESLSVPQELIAQYTLEKPGARVLRITKSKK